LEEWKTVLGPYKSPTGQELADFSVAILDLQMYCADKKFAMRPLFLETPNSFEAMSADQTKQLVVNLFQQCKNLQTNLIYGHSFTTHLFAFLFFRGG
jgi:hypothetical protein